MITNIVVATLTAYCSCKAVCTKGTGITANGQRPIQGITIASSRRVPLGSKVVLPSTRGTTKNLRVYTVQDRMHRKYDKEYRFDTYFKRHNDALKFGIKTNQTVIIITK